jgi:TetR/AcrR family transcriptional repressor of mexJK operon
MPRSKRPNPPGRPKDPEKRAAILEAAKALFPVHGFEKVSMDAIARHAGVSKLTLYSHFADKTALFEAAVCERCEAQIPHRLFEPQPGHTLTQSLRGIGRAFLDLVLAEETVQLHRILIGQGSQPGPMTQVFFNAGPKRALEEMQHFLEHAQLRGELAFPDARHAAEHFFALLKGVRHFRVLVGLATLPSEAERSAHVEEVVELFLRGYGRAPTGNPRAP